MARADLPHRYGERRAKALVDAAEALRHKPMDELDTALLRERSASHENLSWAAWPINQKYVFSGEPNLSDSSSASSASSIGEPTRPRVSCGLRRGAALLCWGGFQGVK
jgi:hypothetical protein